jgi:GT2 family glycosyltransferase
MSHFSNKFMGLLTRLLCKTYELLLTIYTVSRRGLERDQSQILLDYYSIDQTRFQVELNQAMVEQVSSDYEILIIIPFRDCWNLTDKCLESLSRQITRSSTGLKVVLVDNGSVESETAAGIKSVKSKYPNLAIETLRADYPFNFSKLNNQGFKKYKTSKTKFVVFLNNDVQLIDQNLLSKMSSCLQSVPSVGVIGCTLLYPTGNIQHIFATPGCKIIAAHPLKGVFGNQPLRWFDVPLRPVPAVTGALMMMRASDFEAVGMFDESLLTLGQDIGLCLDAWQKLGKFTATVTKPSAIHHESMTKAPKFPSEEVRRFYNKYDSILDLPALYSARLSRWSEKPLLALPKEPKYPVFSVLRYWQ